MNCSEIATLLPEYAIDMLDDGDVDRVNEHLATGCAACNRELRELRVATSALAADLEPERPPIELKQNLLLGLANHAQVPADTERPAPPATVRIAATPAKPATRWWRAIPYAAAAAVAFAIGVTLQSPNDQPSETAGQREAAYQAYIGQLQKSFDNRKVRLADFVQSEQRSGRAGAAVIDPVAGELHLMFHVAEPPGNQQALIAWARDAADQLIVVGMVSPNSDGQVSSLLMLPRLQEPIRSVVVTSEPMATPPAPGSFAEPRGPVQLVANFE